MADFDSQFWSFFVGIVTLASILGVVLLVVCNLTRAKVDDTDSPQTTGHVWDEDLLEYDNPLPRWWLYLFYITLVFGTVYLLLYPGLGSFQGLLNWNQIGQYEAEVAKAEKKFGSTFEQYLQADIVELAKNEAAMKSASRVFSQSCAVCHGSDARGAPGIPNLRDDDWIYGNEPETILTTIQKGRVGIMPGWEAALGGSEGVRNVAEYVLKLGNLQADEARAQKGETQFKTICAACHGVDGKGNPALGGMNLTDDVWVHGNSIEKLSEIIGKGIQNQMPAHLDILGEGKTKLVAAYVISLSN